ncbi:MAG TPA: CocE/NonD family hydrolase [Steroidobacter sp.]
MSARYAFSGSLFLLVAGVTLALSACMKGSMRLVAIGATLAGLAVTVCLALQAGPLGSLRSFEWAQLAAHLVAWPVFAALVAWASRRAIWLGIASAALAIVAIGLTVGGLRTYINPILVSSRYLEMRDGEKIAISTFLPRARGADERLPTIVHQTRYQRMRRIRFPFSIVRGPYKLASALTVPLVKSGYAYVMVDVRGSGASTGVGGAQPFDAISRDGAEVVAWIRRQPWSNGVVGAEGISYNGTTAEMLLRNESLSIKAVMPMFSGYDFYEEVYRPGGVFSDSFLRSYDLLTSSLDANRGAATPYWLEGVAPVDEDESGEMLKAALEAHKGSPRIFETYSKIEYKDDVVEGHTMPQRSPYSYRDAVRASGAAIYAISGWYDGKYPFAVTNRFINTPNAGSKLLIGPWDHGAHRSISPCKNERNVHLDLPAEARRFFDWHLKGIDTGIANEPAVKYYVMCGGKWRTADMWPPPGTETTLYLGPDRSLALTPPQSAGADAYQVDLTATSGTGARWQSYVNSINQYDIGYPDRTEQSKKLLVYRSAVLEEDLEIAGNPLVHLQLSSSTPDGNVIVYLEEVDENGHVNYITEGELRLIHRKLSQEQRPYASPAPYRTYERRDATPMTPGETAEIVLDLIPIAYLVRKGHRLQLSIAGADQDNFAALPGPPPLYHIHWGPSAPSRILLPIVRDAN